MAQRNIGANWNRDNRNNMNDNFTELYAKYQEYFTEITEDLRADLIEGAHIEIKGYVELETDLPSNSSSGDTYFIVDSGIWKRWNGNNWDSVAKTDTSEFIALREDFEALEVGMNDFSTLLNQAFTTFQTEVRNDIDDKLGDIEAQVQTFIEQIEGQIIYVVDEGENSNGRYVKYSDGRMWCQSPIYQVTTENSVGIIYRSESIVWEFPQEFVSTPTITTNTAIVSRWSDTTSTPDTDRCSFSAFSAHSSITLGNIFGSAEGWWR